MLKFPKAFPQPAEETESGGGPAYLDSVIASACCDLDATIAASYPGAGQTWANLIAAPADGATQSAYDFYLGADSSASTDAPTFTGSAGSASAYFALDGGDFFASKSFSAMPTLYNMHKSGPAGGKWWVAMAYFAATTTAKAVCGSGYTGPDTGLYIYPSSGGYRRVYRCDGSGTLSNAGETDAANDWAGSADDVLLIVSADMSATANNIRIWTVSGTSVLLSQNWGTFTGTADSPLFAIGGSYNTQLRGPMNTGAKIYHFSCGNEFLDDTKAAAIYGHLETRHGRPYT